ncbi:MAG TPA: hypothetical protein VGS22_04335 [Thermoanaerobaculia bacterium]|jgi:transcriptional regulator with XRE-family HTH domain|nr:hypothetical protein [Thermoanaerobaculia bacterium]
MSTKDELAAQIRVARGFKGWKQGYLARKARIDPSALSRYEREGGAPLAVKEKIFSAIEVPPDFAEGCVSAFRVLEGAADRPAGSAADLADALGTEVANRFAAMLAPALAVLSVPAEPPQGEERPPAAEDRAEAESLFLRLLPYKFDERLLVVSTGRQYRSVALCERLCDESENAAARNAEDSLDWSKLALRVAERIPGSEAKRSKAMGYAWAFVGNSRRVAAQFPIDEAFARSRQFYNLGRNEVPGWFVEARVLDREASWRRDQGRYGEAFALHDRALDSCQDSSRARLLLNQAATFEQAGQPERALLALEEARPAIERGEGGLRYRWLLRFNLAKNLVHLYRASEAEALLPELSQLAAELGNDLDQLRTRVLGGEVVAGLRRWNEALAELSAARDEFTELKLFADAAVVGLNEAVILLGDLRTAKVRTLVRAMKPIFDSLGLKREALASYRLFVAAVEREAATATMARELAKTIERAGKRRDGAAYG